MEREKRKEKKPQREEGEYLIGKTRISSISCSFKCLKREEKQQEEKWFVHKQPNKEIKQKKKTKQQERKKETANLTEAMIRRNIHRSSAMTKTINLRFSC